MVQIENEYFLNGKGDMDLDYIKALEKGMIDAGVEVPLTFNDVGMKNRLVKGPGHVDLYGFDSYPQSLDWDACGAQEWRPVDERYHDYFESTSARWESLFISPSSKEERSISGPCRSPRIVSACSEPNLRGCSIFTTWLRE